MRIIGNEKGLNWILVGKMSTSCNISSRTTCRRATVVQKQDLPAAAAAEACSTNKQICGLSCALLGTR